MGERERGPGGLWLWHCPTFIACTWLIILAGRGALKVNTNLLSTTAGSWGEMILATLCVDMDVQSLRAPFFRCVTQWSGCVNYRRYKEIIFSNFFVLVFFFLNICCGLSWTYKLKCVASTLAKFVKIFFSFFWIS